MNRSFLRSLVGAVALVVSAGVALALPAGTYTASSNNGHPPVSFTVNADNSIDWGTTPPMHFEYDNTLGVWTDLGDPPVKLDINSVLWNNTWSMWDNIGPVDDGNHDIP